jgi:ferredoxin
MYRIEIDRSLCSGYGSCIDAAPELFELGPDGVAVARVDATRAAEVLDAASACPMAAIAVREVVEEEARGLAA